MTFGSIEFSDNIGTYKDIYNRPYALIKKVPNPDNDPNLLNSGASILLEQGARNYGTIQFGGTLTNPAGGGAVGVGPNAGSIWSGKRPTASDTSGNYYPLGFEMGFNATGGLTNGIAITTLGGILVMSISALGTLRDGGGFDMLSSTTLGTRVVNSSLTSVGTLTSLTVNGNVSVKPASNFVTIDASSELVGIGTATPGHKLDVNGNINSTGTYKISGTDVLTSTALGSSVVNSSLTSLGTLTDLVVSGNIAGTMTTASQPHITSVGTLTELTVSGNVSATNLAGTLTTAAQPNITSVGTLTSLTVSGSVTYANVNASNIYQIGGTRFLAAPNSGSVALGINAGLTSQATNSVAIGINAGYNTQGSIAVAVGSSAGYTNQGSSAVAIGANAGQTSQGTGSIAIGTNAGVTNQHAQTIILNGTGSALNSDGNLRFYVDPIRNIGNTNFLQYNASTKEVTYSTTFPQPSESIVYASATTVSSGTLSTLASLSVTPGTYSVTGSIVMQIAPSTDYYGSINIVDSLSNFYAVESFYYNRSVSFEYYKMVNATFTVSTSRNIIIQLYADTNSINILDGQTPGYRNTSMRVVKLNL